MGACRFMGFGGVGVWIEIKEVGCYETAPVGGDTGVQSRRDSDLISGD